MPFASFCQHFTGGGKLNSDPEALVGVNLFQAVFHKLSDDRGTEAEEENSCVRPHSYHGMVVTEAYHRIWFDLKKPMSMIHQNFVHGSDDPESRRDLPHPNHRSSGFNALMTYACCARM